MASYIPQYPMHYTELPLDACHAAGEGVRTSKPCQGRRPLRRKMRV